MARPTVFIIDDDAGFRDSVSLLLETTNLSAECFASAEDFLKVCNPNMQGCLLLDVRMPGMSGPELQEELARRDVRLPIIFLTAYAEVRTGIQAMKHGAVEFLPKPVNGAALLQVVQDSLALNHAHWQAEATRRLFEARLQKLTGREREVLGLALSGISNKEIATILQVSMRTIEGHRSRIFLKFEARSLLEISQRAAEAGVVFEKLAPNYPVTSDSLG